MIFPALAKHLGYEGAGILASPVANKITVQICY